MNEIAQVSKWQEVDSNRGPLDQQSMLQLLQRRSSVDCVVVSTSALHDGVLSSIPGLGMGMFGVKTWLSTLETVYLS